MGSGTFLQSRTEACCQILFALAHRVHQIRNSKTVINYIRRLYTIKILFFCTDLPGKSGLSFRFGCIYNRRGYICYRLVVFLDRGSFMTFGALPRAPVTAAVCSPILVWVPFLYVPIGLMYISLLVIKGRSFRNAKLDKICPCLVSAVLFHLCWVSSLLQ